MENYVKSYEIITKNLVDKYFPLLKNRKIVIEEKETEKYRAHISHFHWGFRIIISTRLRAFPRRSWKRIIIHELCHLEIFSRRSWITTNIEFILFLLFKKVRNKVERDANVLMIQKGFGKEVLIARKTNISRGLDFPLTEREIKNYIKKFKQRY